jgi:hypothetical protein
MAPTRVFLPTCALKVKRCSAFVSVGTKEIAKALLADLFRKKLQVDCPTYAEASHVEPSIYQSPLSAYFDDSNSFNITSVSKSASCTVQLEERNIGFYSLTCTQVSLKGYEGTTDKLCSSTTSSSVKVHGSNSSRLNDDALIVDGLPCKSPMSAYFDGRDDGFSLGCNSAYDNVISLAPMPGFTTISKQSPTCSQELSDEAPPKVRSICWADEIDEKQPLRLAELILDSFKEDRPSQPGSIWELSKDAKGCRKVQEALDHCDCVDEGIAIAAHFKGRVIEAIRCPHANHVLRKIIMTLPPTHSTFVIEEIVEKGLDGVREIATHRYGCRIMEELLKNCRPAQLADLADFLLVDSAVLCIHMYGNYVMQSLLRNASSMQRQKLVKTIIDHAVLIGSNFYGCSVLAHVLNTSTDESHLLTRNLLSVDGLLTAMNSHKHGRAIVEGLLADTVGEEFEAVKRQLALPAIRVTRAAKQSKKSIAR